MNTVAHPLSVIDAINRRRSVRSYAGHGKTEHLTIWALLAAAVWALTAIHKEPWSFVIVQDEGTLKRLSDRAKEAILKETHEWHVDRGGHAANAFEQPEFNIFYNADTLIIICGNAAAPFVVADCWLAAANLMLAALSMGLGTCVIGSAISGINLPEMKAELGIPAELSAIAPIILGVPAAATPPTTRKEPNVLAWK
jgi:nitroreductase